MPPRLVAFAKDQLTTSIRDREGTDGRCSPFQGFFVFFVSGSLTTISFCSSIALVGLYPSPRKQLRVAYRL